MIAVIVQARLGSKRFPGKVLANLCGLPVLWHVLTRCLKIKGADRVVLATTNANRKALGAVAGPLGVEVFSGPDALEDDVLGRYLAAAREIDAETIVRITADCPMLDPELCADVLTLVTKDRVDYASNSFPERTFEKGLDCEAFTRKTLEMTAHRASNPYDREHVTPFIQRTSAFLKGTITSGEPERGRINLCVDYPYDLEMLALRMTMRPQ